MKMTFGKTSWLVRRVGFAVALNLIGAAGLAEPVDVLVVAGGGGGGSTYGGGGGGGGVVTNSAYSVTLGVGITVTVGEGGAGSSSYGAKGVNGGNSVFGTITAIGGGGGDSFTVLTGGSAGGSGGGGNGSAVSQTAGGAGTSGQGNAGGQAAYAAGGGGGGATAAGGASAGEELGGHGGNGFSSSISGTARVYSGGGGGGTDSIGTAGSGGTGGGGAGGGSSPATSATYYGGGGGGSSPSPLVGGNGYQGIVIVRYTGAQRATGGTITSAGGYTVHTFTGSGTFLMSVPTITSSLTASMTQSIAGSYTITASGGPTSFNATGLPTGLSINTSTGVISGTPTVPGSYTVTISATNGGGTGSASLALTVDGGTVTLTPNGTVKTLLNGNVGIGTTNASHLLTVNGTIRAKEIIVETGWADFVFDQSYRLAPLSEVEAHIQAAGHLPGIPSAAEIAAQGASLGEMQVKLLQKIEELTLHLIRIEKENVELGERVQALEAAP